MSEFHAQVIHLNDFGDFKITGIHKDGYRITRYFKDGTSITAGMVRFILWAQGEI
jgi:hypothetical protein